MFSKPSFAELLAIYWTVKVFVFFFVSGAVFYLIGKTFIAIDRMKKRNLHRRQANERFRLRQF